MLPISYQVCCRGDIESRTSLFNVRLPTNLAGVIARAADLTPYTRFRETCKIGTRQFDQHFDRRTSIPANCLVNHAARPARVLLNLRITRERLSRDVRSAIDITKERPFPSLVGNGRRRDPCKIDTTIRHAASRRAVNRHCTRWRAGGTHISTTVLSIKYW